MPDGMPSDGNRPKTKMKSNLFVMALTVLIGLFFFCAQLLKDEHAAPTAGLNDKKEVPSRIAWFPVINPARLASSPHVDFIAGLKGYQQTTKGTARRSKA